MTYLRFTYQHVDPILDGEKTVTVRLDLERGIRCGDHLDLLDEDGETFGTGKVDRVGHMSAASFVEGEWDGHRSYRSIGQFLDELRDYYPDRDEHLHPGTQVVAIWLDQIEEADGYRVDAPRQRSRGER